MSSICFTILLAIITLFGGPTESSREQSKDVERAATIKAGMVLNFIRYTDWPETTFANSDSPIVLIVLGDSPITGQIEETVKDQKAHGRSIEIRRMAYPTPAAGEKVVSEKQLREFHEKLRASHVLFICESERDRVESMREALQASNVLTVSSIDSFAERGGMLGLAIRNDRVAFDANQKEIERTKLKVSSQLLRLARVVESRGK